MAKISDRAYKKKVKQVAKLKKKINAIKSKIAYFENYKIKPLKKKADKLWARMSDIEKSM